MFVHQASRPRLIADARHQARLGCGSATSAVHASPTTSHREDCVNAASP
jgi:hypothetical protein